MANSSKNQIQKILSNSRWVSKLDKEEVEQEELIQLWKNPELEGYQGLLAYNEFVYIKYKELKEAINTVPIKKNIPAEIAGMFLYSNTIFEILSQFPIEERGKICLLIKPVIENYYTGKNLFSIRKLSKELLISKSLLGRLIKEIRSKLFVI